MDTEKNNIKISNLITAYLSGEASKEEMKEVENWIRLSGKNRKLFDEFKKTWEGLERHQPVHKINTDAEWIRFKEKVSRTTVQTNLKKDRRVINLTRLYRYAAAAVVLIAIFTGGMYISKRNYIIFETAGSLGDVWLPDSTHVHLNIHSKIRYPREFKNQKRVVKFEGEAFFEVQPDKLRPFRIRVGEIGVEVLGTSFDVLAYKDRPAVEVVVQTGKVAMGNWSGEAPEIVLEAGSKGSFDSRAKSFSKSLNTNLNYNAWSTGKLVFVDEEFENIIQTVNQVYHCNIIIQDTSLQKCRLTTTFDNLPLEAVLNILTSTLNVEFKREGEKLFVTGRGC